MDDLKQRAVEEYRRLLMRSMTVWAQENGFEPARHHALLINKLEALAHGDLRVPRLAIFMPPGSAKSTYASILFPPWAMANHHLARRKPLPSTRAHP